MSVSGRSGKRHQNNDNAIIVQTMDVNLNSEFSNDDWGCNHEKYSKSWLHSDMRDMAYHYVNRLFEDFVSRGEIK